MRDQRDPQKLGDAYLAVRSKGLDIETSVNVRTDDYEDGGLISNDPSQHHSKTPQQIGDLSDGG